VEARIPKKEQSRLESFSVGDRIRAVIKTVERSGKNAGVIISRAAPELVERLFEQEVPEIYDGTVQIRASAREAGERTKIAVTSRDRDVDSVGACVGMKGMRVQSIIRELRGEKIDIIEYSEDFSDFAMKALSPARITRVAILDPVGRHMEVIVDDTQLSLAIGKKGQNVRLAAKLLGWRIDIKSEEEKRQEVETQMEALVPGAAIGVLADYGLEESYIGILLQSGINTVERLGSMTPEDLEGIPGVEPEAIPGIQSAVIAYFNYMEASAAQADEVASEEALAEPAETADAAGVIETAAPDGAEAQAEAAGTESTADAAGEPAAAAAEPPSETTA
jgi:transcription termination/antitermination protein NusA